jgi:origin recognition complex subunit 3
MTSTLMSLTSQHVPELPFIFLLSTLSPVPVNFIQSTYRRNTLALLQLSYVSSPSGIDVVEDIVSSVRSLP